MSGGPGRAGRRFRGAEGELVRGGGVCPGP